MAKSTSVEAETQRIAMAARGDVPDPPPGCSLRSEEEKVWWSNYTSLWAANEWRTCDLIIVYKIIENEREIKEQRQTIEVEGDMLENNRGTPVVNPRKVLIKQLQDQILSFMRSVGYFADSADKQAKNKRGAKQDTANRSAKTGPTGLLAKRSIP